MTINMAVPPGSHNIHGAHDLRPRITVIGVGGAGGNAVNNMIRSSLDGVEFVVANTDAQALSHSACDRRIQLGVTVTQGLGAGSRPDIGRIAAEEALEEIVEQVRGSNMAFIAAGMGGGTGTGAAPVIARAAREQGILTVGVVTKPFQFEGSHRMRIAEQGIIELEQFVDTLIIIPNQNLFRVANERTTFADAFKMADDVLQSGVRGVTDLMVMPGLINLDFADIRAVMSEMGKAMMGTGEATGDRRALDAAEAAISNPLLDDVSMKGARGVLINITGGPDLTLFEVDEAANRIRSEVDQEAFIIFGSTFDERLDGRIRVSVVATGMDVVAGRMAPSQQKVAVNARAVETNGRGHGHAEEALVAAEAQAVDLHRGAAFLHAFGNGEATVIPGDASTGDSTGDVFIPPAPVLHARGDANGEALHGDGTNGGAPRSGNGDGQRPRAGMSGLFSRMTGGGRSHKNGNGSGKGEVAQRPAEEEKESNVTRHPRLGGMNPDERLPASAPADELLEIPAFLRRQAN